eukprot:CAMPEP_0183787150 /NCGR_PEP_ID=MMETSP0739-20130205/67395_1 /TAXON_ID=385413 /ORGANISM="Thalassiosira miniscula, Strain CCMP1093" /LENGTH=395 /DNA_ID=CAMNT_0026031227 /DNA_START=129 /DNA_END=1316 /DNA_ORIENTATION=-
MKLSVRAKRSLLGWAISVVVILQDLQKKYQYPVTTTTSWHSNTNIHSNNTTLTKKKTEQQKVHIFYNLFTQSSNDEARVRKIVEEQFALVDPTLHEPNVTITSIGHRLPLAKASLGNASYHIRQHHQEGDEYLTLHALWEFCRRAANHPQQHGENNNVRDVRVAYLHSKGSYTPNPTNDKLRRFLTRGALSSECADLPPSCDVCSSRMSPLPHPHTSGNMWLARCDYVSKLISPSPPLLAPKKKEEGGREEMLLPKEEAAAAMATLHNNDDACKGRGRYFSEHWIHSHPSVRPCDLYTGKEFVWAYKNIPDEALLFSSSKEEEGKKKVDLQMAPRFTFSDYVDNDWCQNDGTQRMENFVALREEQYRLLYNVTGLEGDWWGWDFLHRSMMGYEKD